MEIEIKKVRKKDLVILKKYFKIYKPFLERYSKMKEGKSLFFIVWEKGIPIGHASIILKKVPIIEDLYLNKKSRSRRLGDVLLRRLESILKRKKYKRVILNVFSNNPKLKRFYLRNGYFFTGRKMNNEFEMEKSLV